jgi:hypothetical protein
MASNLKSDLLNCLSGSNVIVDGDEAWPDAIKRWTGYLAKFPAAVVQVTSEEDVIATVRVPRPLLNPSRLTCVLRFPMRCSTKGPSWFEEEATAMASRQSTVPGSSSISRG